MNPIEFKPASAAEFIGPARKVALTLDSIITRCAPTGAPLKVLLYGLPGVGKSALADYLLARLQINKFSITKLSGTEVRLEDVQEWAGRLCYRDLFSSYKILRIEEMDRASHTARAGMLNVLDDLPDHVGVICTTNQSVKELEPRFLSRFQAIEVKPPAADEIKTLLSRFKLRKTALDRISQFACGNVRLALNDAQTALDESFALKAA